MASDVPELRDGVLKKSYISAFTFFTFTGGIPCGKWLPIAVRWSTTKLHKP